MNLVKRTELLAVAIGKEIKKLYDRIGEVSVLQTQDKTNLVNAVNELVGKQGDDAAKIAAAESHIGNLSQLATTGKTSLVGAINEIFGRTAEPGTEVDKVGNLQLLTTEAKSDAVAAINEVSAKAKAADNTALVGSAQDFLMAPNFMHVASNWTEGHTIMGVLGTTFDLAKSAFQKVEAEKVKVGELSNLTTEAKESIVAAINELKAASADTTKVQQLIDGVKTENTQAIRDAIAALKAELMGEDVDAALDTFKELSEAMKADKTALAAMATQIGNRLKVDEVHNLTSQQLTNVYTSLNLGDPDTDFVALFEAELNPAAIIPD